MRAQVNATGRTRKFVMFGAFLLIALGTLYVWHDHSREPEPESEAAAASSEEPGHAVIYPDGAQAESDLAAALAKAGREKKRVLVDFGGNWCGDCQVLEIYFHTPANRPLLDANYVLVPVNIGKYDENLAIAARYGVPVTKGVPALAVLDPDGHVVYSQRHSDFASMRSMDPGAVTAFLQQWKAGA